LDWKTSTDEILGQEGLNELRGLWRNDIVQNLTFFGNIKTNFPASEPVKISIFVFFINPLHVLQQRNTDAVK
jgi:hypothetical protein